MNIPEIQPMVQQPTSNGVTRPRENTKTGKVWFVCDELSKSEQRPISLAEVMKVLLEHGYNEATIRTQYAYWRKFNGVTGRIVSPEIEAEKAAKAAEKEAAKAKREEERQAKLAEKEAAKAKREAEREEKAKEKAEAKAKREAEREAKRLEKEAEAAAKKAKREEEKAAKEAQKQADAAAKAEAKAKADAAKAAKAAEAAAQQEAE